jgi:flagellar motor switch protein FliN/FliY
MILDLPLEVSVRLGNTKILIRDLLRLDKNSVLELDQSADDPLDIVVNDRVLARGEVVVIDDRLGIRITDITSRAERVSTLA